ncbi:transcriptional regulator [Erythrobacter sp. 3-20A1M]|uniref:S24 family peptidase n=1 Tax=Erythrobacter sp. 3-20A1M TaxID=2653850 RepID=UPI001BFC9F62|nr:S24 family peptidase [Erythrobacter sp. 3-20A1M]QWC56029.1 transcriptional regulator [Erythrobacter sp. 3-20A1M]
MTSDPSSEPRERLLALAQEKRASLAALSEMIGRNPSYLQQFVRKGSPRKLEEGDRRRLAEFFGVAESELGGREENSYAGGGKADKSFVAIPRLGIAASAGPGQFAQGEKPFDHFGFSARWLRDNGFDPRMLSVLTVEGDSMEPLLRKGDEILVDRTPRPLRDAIHIVRMDDSLLVKRVALAGQGRITLLSENRAYPALEVDLSEVEVVGRVVWKGGRL